MAVLNKTWGSATGLAPKSMANVTSQGEEEEGVEVDEPTLLDKPMMIYVTDGAEAEGYDKVEKIVLMDDKVCVGMWAFNCVKMTSADAAKDPILEDTGDDVPRFIFVSRDMDDVDVIGENKMSAKNVFKQMERHAKKAYKTKFTKNVKAVIKVLGEYDKIANSRKLLAQKEAGLEKPSKGELKKIEKEKAELDEREKAAVQEKEELLKFELKEIKAA